MFGLSAMVDVVRVISSRMLMSSGRIDKFEESVTEEEK